MVASALAGCGNTDSWVDAAPATGWPAQYADAANSSYTGTPGAHDLRLDWTRSVKGSLDAAVALGSGGYLAANAQTAGGYAKEMSKEYQAKQAELTASHIAKQDIVITTALIPGRPAPKLITAAMVESMKAGSVIVDLAVERGGNCELAKPGEVVVTPNGVRIVGHLNVPGRLAATASQLYAKNLLAFVELHGIVWDAVLLQEVAEDAGMLAGDVLEDEDVIGDLGVGMRLRHGILGGQRRRRGGVACRSDGVLSGLVGGVESALDRRQRFLGEIGRCVGSGGRTVRGVVLDAVHGAGQKLGSYSRRKRGAV